MACFVTDQGIDIEGWGFGEYTIFDRKEWTGTYPGNPTYSNFFNEYLTHDFTFDDLVQLKNEGYKSLGYALHWTVSNTPTFRVFAVDIDDIFDLAKHISPNFFDYMYTESGNASVVLTAKSESMLNPRPKRNDNVNISLRTKIAVNSTGVKSGMTNSYYCGTESENYANKQQFQLDFTNQIFTIKVGGESVQVSAINRYPKGYIVGFK